ncbi:ribonuclease P [Candidatus Woesearchaeota archaeon CG10_big_fil_rev_8_21_14_0_10_30_7]|nr:MAG: ribonuclease P [Candidatus Woesearchaeota archaeon CG10_big_fil_rev_8_21_14_0_10_30_7]
MTKKKKSKKEARKDVELFFSKARDVFDKNKSLANDYVRKARRVMLKYRMRVPKLKSNFCKYCYSYLVIGKNARSRTREGKIVITCFECKNFTRLPFIREKKVNKRV